MRALVVDDSRAMRAILGNILRELGFEVAEAADGPAALAARRAGEAELMVVDWHLPDMSGPELIRAVRAEAAWNGTRILMVTTEVERESVAKALRCGVTEYVMKPFTRDVLLSKLALLGLRPS